MSNASRSFVLRKTRVAAFTMGVVVLSFALSADANAWSLFNRGSTYTKTKYPIVLAHGLLGFDKLVGAIDYFYKVPESLRKDGATVYVTQVTPVASSYERGEQLLAQIETIVAMSGAEKVNIIAHSQGGIDARYVAAVRPDLVASVTTVGSPHTGSDVADVLLEVPEDLAPLTEAIFNALGSLIELAAGEPLSEQDAAGAVESLSSAGAAEFNALYPTGLPARACGVGVASANGMRFYSWSGTETKTNLLDISDLVLDLSGSAFTGANDGLVGRCSSHFGVVLRDDYKMNHLDEINQTLGLTALFGVDPVSLYRNHANRLKNAGL